MTPSTRYCASRRLPSVSARTEPRLRPTRSSRWQMGVIMRADSQQLEGNLDYMGDPQFRSARLSPHAQGHFNRGSEERVPSKMVAQASQHLDVEQPPRDEPIAEEHTGQLGT